MGRGEKHDYRKEGDEPRKRNNYSSNERVKFNNWGGTYMDGRWLYGNAAVNMSSGIEYQNNYTTLGEGGFVGWRRWGNNVVLESENENDEVVGLDAR